VILDYTTKPKLLLVTRSNNIQESSSELIRYFEHLILVRYVWGHDSYIWLLIQALDWTKEEILHPDQFVWGFVCSSVQNSCTRSPDANLSSEKTRLTLTTATNIDVNPEGHWIRKHNSNITESGKINILKRKWLKMKQIPKSSWNIYNYW
jgi:hypothetical protein